MLRQGGEMKGKGGVWRDKVGYRKNTTLFFLFLSYIWVV